MIFVICGKKRTGKDTAAKILEETGDFDSFAFADYIKYILEEAATKCGVVGFSHFKSDNVFWQGDREKPLLASNTEVIELFITALKLMREKGYILDFEYKIVHELVFNTELWSIRRLMQVFGTDIVCNKIDPSVWVRLAVNESFKPKFLEAVHYQTLSKHILFTDCRQLHEYKYMQRLGAKFIFLEKETGETDNHSTELGLTPCPDDYIIDNNGTLCQLKTNILNLIKSV